MGVLSISHIKGNTYYIPSPTNIGIYVENNEAVLIDSGNDKEAGRQILRLINEQGWSLKLIINTHSNADHIGGNNYLQEKTGCKIAATQMEAAFINNPLLEPAFLIGSYPNKDLINKFLMAKPSEVTTIVSAPGTIEGTSLEAISLPGHFFDMIGVKTPDNIFFTADSLLSERIIKKYNIFYLLNIGTHLKTINEMRSAEADLFVPSHGEPVYDIKNLVDANEKEIYKTLSTIQDICSQPLTYEEILAQVCTVYNIPLNPTQYVLVLSTIKAFLSYLYEEGIIDCIFENGKMMWERKKYDNI